jgi:hypothetical protein
MNFDISSAQADDSPSELAGETSRPQPKRRRRILSAPATPELCLQYLRNARIYLKKVRQGRALSHYNSFANPINYICTAFGELIADRPYRKLRVRIEHRGFEILTIPTNGAVLTSASRLSIQHFMCWLTQQSGEAKGAFVDHDYRQCGLKLILIRRVLRAIFEAVPKQP